MMAFAIVRLMQASGVQGPSEAIDYAIESDGREWAAGQSGHPWDTLTIVVYEDQEDSESGGDASDVIELAMN